MARTYTRSLPLRANRSLVQRLGAERYLILSLVAFAGSVILTRMFLDLTGYPQIGGGTLHIAHVLWGGLLLFIGGLLPLVFANAFAFTASALLNGVGMGLFIDEVGKFITQNNDYFFPAAAPIIYAFFVMIVLMYVYISRSNRGTPRHQMYQALHDLGEVIDHDLDARERAALETRLQRVIDADPADNLALLAGSLITFLHDEELRLAAIIPSRTQQLKDRFDSFSQRLNQTHYRNVLVGLLLGSGLIGVISAVSYLAAALPSYSMEATVQGWMRAGILHSFIDLRLLIMRITLEGVLSALLVVGAILMLLRRDKPGVEISIVALVMLLTTVNLLVFYFDQFSAAAVALAQLSVLTVLVAYRRWYLQPVNPPGAIVEKAWHEPEISE